jgi:hypothetical protein
MAKKKLLLIVGAGASNEFGMLSVADAGKIINAAAQERYALRDRPDSNLYKHIEGMVQQYWRDNNSSGLDRSPNFEDILYAIFALVAAYPFGVHTSALGALIEAKQLPEFDFHGRGPTRIDHKLRIVGTVLVDALLSAFREKCKMVERDKQAEFFRLKSLMAALQAEFEVAVVSLNYDNIIYRALPGIEIGFDQASGRFVQDRIFSRKKWACMLHLHGSVHFDMPTNGSADMHEVCWKPDINDTFSQNSFGRGMQITKEGAHFPVSAIVAGYGKTTQLLRRPFRTYYSELDRLVATCEAVLFAGYGFGDTHLNGAFEGFRDSRRRPVAAIGLAGDDVIAVSGTNSGDCSQWATAVLHTFETPHHSMRDRRDSIVPTTVRRLKEEKEFEFSIEPKTPLSFWYNGMLAACDAPDKVIARLK